MARYTCSYLVNNPLEQLQGLLSQTLRACNFEVIYHTPDYMMAKEIPGRTSFARLVAVEVLIDSTTATNNEVQINLVVKNDELPLQLDNHCRQLFDQVQTVIAKNHQWQLLENIPG